MLEQPPTLRGRHVTLEPAERAHAAALLACTARDTFRFFPSVPPTWDVAGFEAVIDRAHATPDRRALVTRLASTGEVVGCTSYLEIRPAHRGVEIGFTWIAAAHRGTAVNPEAKLLMLAHAFDELGCIRVQLRTDARNIQSRAAILKLGAVQEGVLRKHVIMPDGFFRDTVMFSITREEWPRVRAGLEKRVV